MKEHDISAVNEGAAHTTQDAVGALLMFRYPFDMAGLLKASVGRRQTWTMVTPLASNSRARERP